MAEDVTRAFSALRSKQERLDALQKLVRAMNADERQHVFSVISDLRDPFHALPVEIVLQIFEYLSVFAVWTLQRVCKRWRTFLSSADFLRSSLSRWNTHDPADSALPIRAIEDDSMRDRLKHLEALKTGNPLQHMCIDDPGTVLHGAHPRLDLRKMDLAGKWLAFTTARRSSGDAVHVRDLVSGEERVLRGDAREGIRTLVLTSCLVAWITFDGALYVSYHAQPVHNTMRTRLPSSLTHIAAGSGEAVAILMARYHEDQAKPDELLIYNARTNRMRGIDIRHTLSKAESGTCKRYPCSLLVDGQRESIDFFSIVQSKNPTPKFLQITRDRISFTGDWLASSTSEKIGGCDLPTDQSALSVPRPTGVRDEYRIGVCDLSTSHGLSYRLRCPVFFDAETGSLVADRMEHASGEGEACARPAEVFWKGLKHCPPLDSAWADYISCVNETFMVIFEIRLQDAGGFQSRIRVLCFEPEVAALWSQREIARDNVEKGDFMVD